MVSEVFQLLERSTQRRHHLFVALAGAVATLLMWWLNLTHPAMSANAFLRGGVSKGWLVIVLAPPFLMVFGLANVVFFKAPTDSKISEPMSGYLRAQASETKWKIVVGSGIASVVNFFLMLFTAGAS